VGFCRSSLAEPMHRMHVRRTVMPKINCTWNKIVRCCRMVFVELVVADSGKAGAPGPSGGRRHAVSATAPLHRQPDARPCTHQAPLTAKAEPPSFFTAVSPPILLKPQQSPVQRCLPPHRLLGQSIFMPFVHVQQCHQPRHAHTHTHEISCRFHSVSRSVHWHPCLCVCVFFLLAGDSV
jgi:hypothetical protein